MDFLVLYGAGQSYVEVTDKFRRHFEIAPGTFVLSGPIKYNEFFGDPIPWVSKQLIISYNGKSFTIPEHTTNLIKINTAPGTQVKKNVFFLCLKQGYQCFEDYVDALGIVDMEVYYDSDKNADYLNYLDKNNVFIFRYFVPTFVSPGTNVYLFNTEQMSQPERFSHVKSLVDRGYTIIDYSIANIRRLKSGLYVPYRINAKETERLKSFSSEKVYDVGIVGISSQRRRDVVDKLRDLGINVAVTSGWKDVRDKEVGKCKLLLNLHVEGDFNIFEHIRCDRWIFAGMTLVSESSEIEKELDIYKSVVWSSYAEISEAVLNTLGKLNSEEKYPLPDSLERDTAIDSFIQRINETS